MKRIVLIIMVLITFPLCIFGLGTAEKPPVIKLSDAAELDAFMTEQKAAGGSVIVLDLREEADFEEAHYPGAFNMPFSDEGAAMMTFMKPHKRDAAVLLFCYRGGRSARGAEMLREAGFVSVYDYSPGFPAYAAEKGDAFVPETGSCGCH